MNQTDKDSHGLLSSPRIVTKLFPRREVSRWEMQKIHLFGSFNFRVVSLSFAYEIGLPGTSLVLNVHMSSSCAWVVKEHSSKDSRIRASEDTILEVFFMAKNLHI